MKRQQALPLILSLFCALGTGAAHAQDMGSTAAAAAPLTREQVKRDRDEFLRTHRWDTITDNWVLKSGVEAPTGVKSRAEVKAERDEFLRNNRWNETRDQWEPLHKAPRDLGTMTREQVRAETRQFVRTHQWDEEKSAWVEMTPKKVKK